MGILRLILLLLLFTCTAVNHAQVRNNQGQKLVSRIEIENYHNKGYVKQRVNITYNYDVSKHLQDVTRTVVYNDEEKDFTDPASDSADGTNHGLCSRLRQR